MAMPCRYIFYVKEVLLNGYVLFGISNGEPNVAREVRVGLILPFSQTNLLRL